MKKIILFTIFCFYTQFLVAQIDLTFGVNGHLINGNIDKDDYPSFMIPTLDNAFLVGDYDMYNTPATINLVKIKANGMVDNTFAGGLFQYTVLPSNIGGFYDAIQLADSSYLVFGNYGIPNIITTNFIIKLDKNGVLDNTYNVDGKITYSMSPIIGAARSAIVDNDGSILVAGAYTTGFALDELYITRFDSNGFIDNSFATNGLQTLNVYDSSACFPVKIFKPDNLHYLIAVRVYNNGNRMLYVRLNNNGSIDSTFGINGIFTLPWINKTYLQGVTIYNNNCYLYGGGFVNPVTQKGKSFIAKTDFTGQLDLNFGTGGIDTNIIDTSYYFSISGLEIDAGGNYLISGTNIKDTSEFMLIKKTPMMVFDNSFGTNGYYLTRTDSSRSDFSGMSCLLKDGSWIIGGHYYTPHINQSFAYDVDMTFCKVVSTIPLLTENINKSDITFYPNPAHNYLSFKNNFTDKIISIYSIDGSLKQTNSIKKNMQSQIDISSLSKGLYFINYQDKNKTYTQKLIVE